MVLPDTITEIDCCAFACCDSLKKLVIPKTIERIDKKAFENSDKLAVVSNEFIADWYGSACGRNIQLGFYEGCKMGYDFSEEVVRRNEKVYGKHGEEKQIFLIAEDERVYPVIKRIKKWKYTTGECSNIEYDVIKDLSEETFLIERAKKSGFILIYGENPEIIKERITDYNGVVITSSQLPDLCKFMAFTETLSFALGKPEISSVNEEILKDFFHNAEAIDIEVKDLPYDEYNSEVLSADKEKALLCISYTYKHSAEIQGEFYEKYVKGFKYHIMRKNVIGCSAEARIITVKRRGEN